MKYKIIMTVLLAVSLTASIGVTPPQASAKSQKSITVKKADTTTAKKIHDALNEGKAVNIKVKGKTRKSTNKLLDKVREKVSKYNKYGVYPARLHGKKSKSYMTYRYTGGDSQIYKYGLQLVRKMVASWLEEADKNRCRIRWEYNGLLEETLQDYKYNLDDLSPSEEISYYDINYNIEGFPLDWGTEASKAFKDMSGFTVKEFAPMTKPKEKCTIRLMGVESEDAKDIYGVKCEDVEAKDNWYYMEAKTLQGVSEYWSTSPDTLSKDDYQLDTFKVHYEPMTFTRRSEFEALMKQKAAEVTAKLVSKMEKEEREEIIIPEGRNYCDLSQAMRVYYVGWSFSRYRERPGSFSSYDSRYGGKYGGGLEGIKASLNRVWKGICSDYASMEMTLYSLMGVEENNIRYVSRGDLNHAWSMVKLKNSKGKTAWCLNDYGWCGAYTKYHEKRPREEKVSDSWEVPDFWN